MKPTPLASLFPHLWPDAGPCPFVVDEGAAKQIVLVHYDAGRDATYVTVSRSVDKKLSNRIDAPFDNPVTIRYASVVQGTTIIYDATEETLQGKARPFPCDLAQQSHRMYALLPFQLEGTALHAKSAGGHQYLNVGFVDACGERIQAALPFELRLIDSNENALAIEYSATDREGQFMCTLPYRAAAAATKAVVRSR